MTALPAGGPAQTGMPLSQATLASLPEAVARPTYDRTRVTPGIVHFGVGGFHRAHQAVYLDTLMNRGRALDWGIVGVGTMPQDSRMRDALVPQDGLYTVVLKHPDGILEPRVIGSVLDYLLASDDPDRVLAVLTDPATRIVSLTITEGGYLFDPSTGELHAAAPSIQPDLVEGAAPSTPFGFITEGLRRRRAAGTPPFTVMSCDNIPGNGDVTRKMVTSFARLKDGGLGAWIEAEVAFPSCMVDRITPVTATDDIASLREQFGVEDRWPVVCEPFTQWALEDRFPLGRPPFDEVGVQLVPDVEPYELMKLRLLNASHQALCYLGYLSGYRFAHEVCQDPLFTDFLLAYMDREATPTLHEVPGVDLTAYKHQLIKRFANPEVRDTLARLCAESSDRIPKWLVPVIRASLDLGGEVERSALVVAAWARYAEGVDEQGDPIEVVDQLRDRVMAAAARQRDEPLAFVEDRQLFGDLARNDTFTRAYARSLASLHEHGARKTLERLRDGG